MTILTRAWSDTIAQGVNSSGEIVGSGIVGGNGRAWLLRIPPVSTQGTSVPEPSSCALFALGLTVLSGLIHRPRRSAGQYSPREKTIMEQRPFGKAKSLWLWSALATSMNWTHSVPAAEFIPLGHPSVVDAISGDGVFAVGFSPRSNADATRWDLAGGTLNLGVLAWSYSFRGSGCVVEWVRNRWP